MSETKEMKPLICRVEDDRVQVLFEGMPQKEFTRPRGEKDDPAVIAFEEIRTLAQKEEWDALLNALRPNNSLGNIVKDDELIEGLKVTKGRVTYKGFRVNNSLTQKIVGMLADANRSQTQTDSVKKLKPLVALLGRTMGNVAHSVVNELFDFIESHDVMVDEDGKLVTLYVTVNKDGKNGRHVIPEGGKWEMPRNMVDHDTALKVLVSSRLHKPEEGSKVLRVVVNPADVVAVNNNSLTVCKMKVKEPMWNDSWDD